MPCSVKNEELKGYANEPAGNRYAGYAEFGSAAFPFRDSDVEFERQPIRPLRKGKWTKEEEEYASQIIKFFNEGKLHLEEGTTLRTHLAEMLNCDPMRITKKFTGASCLGKRVFHSSQESGDSTRKKEAPVTNMEREKAEEVLANMERKFRQRLEAEEIEKMRLHRKRIIDHERRYMTHYKMMKSASIRNYSHQRPSHNFQNADVFHDQCRYGEKPGNIRPRDHTSYTRDLYLRRSRDLTVRSPHSSSSWLDDYSPRTSRASLDRNEEEHINPSNPAHREYAENSREGRPDLYSPRIRNFDEDRYYSHRNDSLGPSYPSAPNSSLKDRYDVRVQRSPEYPQHRVGPGYRHEYTYGPDKPLSTYEDDYLSKDPSFRASKRFRWENDVYPVKDRWYAPPGYPRPPGDFPEAPFRPCRDGEMPRPRPLAKRDGSIPHPTYPHEVSKSSESVEKRSPREKAPSYPENLKS